MEIVRVPIVWGTSGSVVVPAIDAAMDMMDSVMVHKSGMITVILLLVLTCQKRRWIPVLMVVLEEGSASVWTVKDPLSDAQPLVEI